MNKFEKLIREAIVDTKMEISAEVRGSEEITDNEGDLIMEYICKFSTELLNNLLKTD